MNYILFDNFRRNNLLPLTFTRPVCEIRVGIMTIREKWEHYLGAGTSTLTQDYLSTKYPIKKERNNLLINGSICPNEALINEIKSLKPNQALVDGAVIIAMPVTEEELDEGDWDKSVLEEQETEAEYIKINHSWEIFTHNGQAIEEDYAVLTKGRKSQALDDTNTLLGNDIFIEEGAKVSCTTLNTKTGPIYIGKDAEVMEGALIRGPFSLAEGSIIKMGAKIYGPTTIGPYCKIGGEVTNSVFFGLSNKAHDGYLGNSVIGEWCNLGADTNNSNLKNNYEEVKLWSYPDQTFVSTGEQFCGLIMGDHSKTAINTMLNTGTVIGVSSNIFGSGFQRNFIPSFSWGGTHGFKIYRFKKAIEVAERVYKRRGLKLDSVEKDILRVVFDITADNVSVWS